MLTTTFSLPTGARDAERPPRLGARAVTHRNGRLALPRLLSAPLILSAADLGLQAHGLQSLLAERAAVDAEVAGLIGMAPLKRYLAELRAKVRADCLRLHAGCPPIAP